MRGDRVIGLIFEELGRAEKLHPGWPEDPIHQAAIVGEEAGELLQAAYNLVYKDRSTEQYERMRREAVQTAAMALRFLINLEGDR